DALIGNCVGDLFPASSLGLFTDNLRRVAEAGELECCEAYSPLLGGWAQAHFTAYPDGIVVSFRDVTEQRQSTERYRLVFEASPIPMWVYDVETLRFLMVNDAAVRAYGWSREEFLAMDLTAIRPEAEREVLRRYVGEMPSGFNQSKGHWHHLTRSGAVLDVEITSHSIELDGRPARLVHVTDITERRRLEDELRQAQKMEAVGRLAGGIAHDFNNLLTAITNYSELLLDELGSESPLRADVREIRAAADRAGALTRQLLAFGRRQVLQPTTLDVNEVVAELERMLRRLLGPEIVFGVALDAATGFVSADRGQLEQVLVNLVVNARDAMPEGGTLTIETSPTTIRAGCPTELAPGDYVRIAVRDTGTGMDEATQARVFEPFFTTKEAGKGTGLGLPTVYGIVAQSGGAVSIDSAPGKGTCMTILLPRVAGAARPASRRSSGSMAAVPEPAALGTVLLADDEESVRIAVARILRKAGYRVLVAASGSEALGAAEGYGAPIEILLTDLSMPGMNGQELAARIREMRPETRVVLMSGHGGDELARRDLERDGLVFLQKPFTMQGLLGVLASR
ncbi:MAG TPA: ATP-binding protein, partial [Gemmatimonadaceae bacterium]